MSPTKTYIQIFIAVLLLTLKIRKQPKRPSVQNEQNVVHPYDEILLSNKKK